MGCGAAAGRLADELWERFGGLRFEQIPPDVATVAQQCVLDWFGCAVAGSREPLSQILQDELAGATVGAGGSGGRACSVLGTLLRADPHSAALINGAAGHSLDFDDSSAVMSGHPSAPVLPALLALAEQRGCSGAELLAAYVVGVEVQSLIGMGIGPEHYGKGWHTTSTVGVFGAAAASSRLLQLDLASFAMALGIAASGASGLKANFGTMTKPLHAGQAAERGLLAARLAARGFTGNGDAVEGRQGLLEAAGNGRRNGTGLGVGGSGSGSGWATAQVLFKHHASCHCTQPGIEATGSLLAQGIHVGDIERVVVTVNPSILDMCAIAEPVTGLEAKFSLRGTQALVLAGADTTAVATFEDGPINRPEVRELLRLVEVQTDDTLDDLASRVEVVTSSGTYRATSDISRPSLDLQAQGAQLQAKFCALVAPVLGERAAVALAARLSDLSNVADVGELLALARPAAAELFAGSAQ